VVEAVAPKPVNVLTFGLSVETLRKLGVRRISVGGQLARSAYADLVRAATGIVENIDFSAIQGTHVNMNNLYETYREG
jgi:2-methylisocitrate lyase-like PEP mutase family enzyme